MMVLKTSTRLIGYLNVTSENSRQPDDGTFETMLSIAKFIINSRPLYTFRSSRQTENHEPLITFCWVAQAA